MLMINFYILYYVNQPEIILQHFKIHILQEGKNCNFFMSPEKCVNLDVSCYSLEYSITPHKKNLYNSVVVFFVLIIKKFYL